MVALIDTGPPDGGCRTFISCRVDRTGGQQIAGRRRRADAPLFQASPKLVRVVIDRPPPFPEYPLAQSPIADPAAEDAVRARFLQQMRLVPGAVAIVATALGTRRTGLVATAWNSLCADPPMLLACINRRSSAHPIVADARAFSINLLAADHAETVAIFSARRGLDGADRFVPGAWTDGPGGQPLLNDAVAAFECELDDLHDYGTHSILIGRVGAMRSRADAPAMLYLDGGFASAVLAPRD